MFCVGLEKEFMAFLTVNFCGQTQDKNCENTMVQNE